MQPQIHQKLRSLFLLNYFSLLRMFRINKFDIKNGSFRPRPASTGVPPRATVWKADDPF